MARFQGDLRGLRGGSCRGGRLGFRLARGQGSPSKAGGCEEEEPASTAHIPPTPRPCRARSTSSPIHVDARAARGK